MIDLNICVQERKSVMKTLSYRYLSVFLILGSVFALSLPPPVLGIKTEGLEKSESVVTKPASEYETVWGWPIPEKPIPHHDVGHI